MALVTRINYTTPCPPGTTLTADTDTTCSLQSPPHSVRKSRVESDWGDTISLADEAQCRDRHNCTHWQTPLVDTITCVFCGCVCDVECDSSALVVGLYVVLSHSVSPPCSLQHTTQHSVTPTQSCWSSWRVVKLHKDCHEASSTLPPPRTCPRGSSLETARSTPADLSCRR